MKVASSEIRESLIRYSYRLLPKFILSKLTTNYNRFNTSFFGDGMSSIHFIPFLREKEFIEAYDVAFDSMPVEFSRWRTERSLAWRAHIVSWAGQRALRLDGEFVECGVWWGILSKFLMEYIDWNKQEKTFYLCDTWGAHDIGFDSSRKPDYKHDIFARVSERFAQYRNVRFVRGLLPGSLVDSNLPRAIAYLSIDLNGSRSNSGKFVEIEVLEKLYDRLVSGGIIYLDDYGWDFPELRLELDKFFRSNDDYLLHFPSGNSIVIKK